MMQKGYEQTNNRKEINYFFERIDEFPFLQERES